MRTIFRFFRRNPSHGLESLWGFSGPLRSVSHPCGDHLFHRFSLVLVWMGLGELPKRLSIKLEICLVIRALYRALGWHLAHRRRRRTIMSIVVLAGKSRGYGLSRSQYQSNFYKSLSGCH